MGSSTPTTTTQNVIQQQSLPPWYVEYLQNVMGRAVTQADANQPPPPLQQVANLTPDQLAAYGTVRQSQGAAAPYYQGAAADIGAVPTIDFSKAAFGGSPLIQGGTNLLEQAGMTNTAISAVPFTQQATGYLQGAATGSAQGAASPYIQAATQATGLQAASPYLSAAATPSYENVSAYLNPFNRAVTDQIAALGARNLQENILPAIGDTFTRSGQYGSQQMGTFGERAARDTQAAILNAQTQALQQGYGQAMGAAQSDAARMAGLAGTAGGLGTAQQQALLGAGQATGQLSATDLARLQASGVDISQLGFQTAAAQATDAARMLAAGQALGQLGMNVGQLGLGAAQAQANALLGAGQATQNLGTTAQESMLRGAAAQEAAGAAQQGQGQANLNAMFQQQLAQYNLPWDTIAKLSGVVQGLPVGGTTSGQTVTQAPGPSVAGQVGGIGLGVAGLANSGLFKQAGGPVKKPKRNASYGTLPKRGLALAAA